MPDIIPADDAILASLRRLGADATAAGILRLVTERVGTTYTDDVHLITTDRTGRVDGAWRDADFGPHNGMTAVEPWAQFSRAARRYGLDTLGELVRAYCEHPHADAARVRRDERWPLMVELTLDAPDPEDETKETPA